MLFPKNLSHDTLTESFCGGLQDQLLNELFLIDELHVRSRVGTDRFRNTTMRMPKIGRKIKANCEQWTGTRPVPTIPNPSSLFGYE